jgi:hypothetical protein
MNNITSQPIFFKDISLILVLVLPLIPCFADGLCRRWFARSHDPLKVITIVPEMCSHHLTHHHTG